MGDRCLLVNEHDPGVANGYLTAAQRPGRRKRAVYFVQRSSTAVTALAATVIVRS
jgi:hypothetical protein